MAGPKKIWFALLCTTLLITDGRASGEHGHGVVVEQVTKGSAAAGAGLQQGDVILHWTRSDTGGPIESPFDLQAVEIEQAPRGSITLEGRRDAEKRMAVDIRELGSQSTPGTSGDFLTTLSRRPRVGGSGQGGRRCQALEGRE